MLRLSRHPLSSQINIWRLLRNPRADLYKNDTERRHTGDGHLIDVVAHDAIFHDQGIGVGVVGVNVADEIFESLVHGACVSFVGILDIIARE